ncbi:MAG: translocation/assembly module TamB domain-containing protein [Terracidiphilus sp.]|jgi:translocation and assembly module TamB
MSEPEFKPPLPDETPKPRGRSRLRRFLTLHLPLSVGACVLISAVAIGVLLLWATSAGFEEMVRRHLVKELETATGGRAEIRSFHWHLFTLEADAGGVVLHGLEAPGEAPYAQVENLQARISILNPLSPRILLRSLEVDRPQLHLIVYEDGTTNQPQPGKRKKAGKRALDSFFDLHIGQIEVLQGLLHYENRAAAFDFQDRFIPLDFTARDLSLRMAYIPATGTFPRTFSGAKGAEPESYRIDAAASDFNLARKVPRHAPPPPSSQYFGIKESADQTVQGFFAASVDLTRNAATVRWLRITARGRGIKDRTLEITGRLDDFAHPRWQGRAVGDLDMRLVDPITGYPFTPQGLAHLNLAATGQAADFRIDGSVHVDNGSYIGTGVVATGLRLDARVHADPEQLLITSIVAALRQGGQISGDLSLVHWLPVPPKGIHPLHWLPPPEEIDIPVDGKVTAQFKNVAIDTLMEMVCDPPFQRLGFDSGINGSATALWIKGDKQTLSVAALLNLTPPAQAAAGKVAATGFVDATYTQRDGAVDLRKLEVDLPSSQLLAQGHLGAYPLASPSSLAVDFRTAKLGEFDTVFSDLGLASNCPNWIPDEKPTAPSCKIGVAALPVTFNGPAEFHGTWTGSLIDPRLTGDVKTAQLAVDVSALSALSSHSASSSSASAQTNPASPNPISLDSLLATGSYSSSRIDLTHAALHRGKEEIDLNGSLAAANPTPTTAHGRALVTAPSPSFDARSVLHLSLHAGQVASDDLKPFIAQKLPISGAVDAQLQLDGTLGALDGSGWIEMDKGRVFGEPVARIRAQGSVANQLIRLTSVTVSEDSGKIAATGSFDLASHRFQLDATAAGVDVARLETLRNQGLDAAGTLGFTLQGSGTLDDPRLTAHATLAGLTVSGESLGSLTLNARTANRAATYDLTTQLEGTDFAAHGQTTLSGDYSTHAQLDFSRFNIGTLLKMAHVRGLSGDSALAGTVTFDGPLAHPAQMRGEARLQELAVTLSGVHLQSQGGVHATLDHSLIHLDPLHVTGDQTDLRAEGSLSLEDNRQLDFAASGSINLAVAETFDPDLTASGNTTFKIDAHGPLANPGFHGRIDIQNAALSLEDIPNGLSQLHGTLEFNQNRLEVKSLTAVTGGGQLSVAGYLAYQHGLFANLVATGAGIRIRYPQGVSSLADASFQLQGVQNNLVLTGDVQITRFTVSPDFDFAALAAQTNAQTIAPPDAPSNHIRLDVRITSSPQLNFQNAYAKLAGNVDLHLRGTVAAPSLLGRITITEGSAILAGTRYELQRGEISFTNPVRIEPSIDFNATARVEDYDITLGLHGTTQKMNVSYRSDPPLPEADVVALLALGRTESQQRLYTQQQQQLTNPTTDALLGGALNSAVSSRVQKLFGAGSVKVDPNYLGAFGNSTSRIIVEEQLGRDLTLTYATNVNTTSQQLIQAEVAINRHVSLQLARDESGVFSVVLKATRRYR